MQILAQDDPLEEEMVTHSSILVWKIPWTQESGRLQPMGHKESEMTEQLSMQLKKKKEKYSLQRGTESEMF